MKDYIVAERIRGLPVLFNIISRYGSLKVRKEITREILASLVSRPYYTPIRKKIRGKVRLLHVPSKKLMILLRVILNIILYDFPVSRAAHGGVLKRSIVTNAQQHLNSSSFFHVDFKDYFPSITTEVVFNCLRELFEESLKVGIFRNCGLISFREARGMARIIARLATFNNLLPQGAPTSPCLQNLILCDLDEKILKLTQRQDIAYARFVDDMIFSSTEPRISREIRTEIIDLIKEEVGYFLKFNREKVHYRTGRAKAPVITGVTISKQDGVGELSISRRQLEKYRCMLYSISFGRASQKDIKKAWGIISLVKMVKGKIPTRLKAPFLRFLSNCYPNSWDKILDRYKDLL